jgi:hypothetical protein
VIYASYKEGGHGTQGEIVEKRTPALANVKKWTERALPRRCLVYRHRREMGLIVVLRRKLQSGHFFAWARTGTLAWVFRLTCLHVAYTAMYISEPTHFRLEDGGSMLLRNVDVGYKLHVVTT